jgi:16S rRNA (cytosine(1402)-N(4))-methyltransferase
MLVGFVSAGGAPQTLITSMFANGKSVETETETQGLFVKGTEMDHIMQIIEAHPELHTFIGLDVDPVAHEEARSRLEATSTSTLMQLNLVRTNFRNFQKVLRDVDARLAQEGVDGVLMDLGMSSMQVNIAERGFSFLRDGPADMRMDPSASLRADEILNKWSELEVGRILREYGEERRWRQLARKIVEARLAGGIQTTSQLVGVIGGSKFSSNSSGKKILYPSIFFLSQSNRCTATREK